MQASRREFLQKLAAGAAVLPIAPRIAQAQSYPSRPITILVPFAPGGPTDTIARLLAERMRASLGQTVIIENVTGGAPVMADLIAGRVDFSLASFNSARSNMDAGKLRALAVDAETRLPALPDIPTLIEAGLGAHRVADWAGVLAPAGTPAAIVDRLNREFVKAAHTPELIAKLTENGNIVASSTPQEMSRLVADEVKNMEQLIKTLGLKAQ